MRLTLQESVRHHKFTRTDFLSLNHIISSNTKLESLDQKIMILIELCFRILKYSVSISEENQTTIENKIVSLTQKLIEDIQHDNTFYNLLIDFAKMLTCFNDVVKNGIGFEIHENRYDFDRLTDTVFVLLSEFQDYENVYPVKMEIKTFKVKEKLKLYVLVTSEHIKKEKSFIFPQEHKLNPNGPKNLSSVKISKLLRNVNIEREGLIKYIPDHFSSPSLLLSAYEMLLKLLHE